MKKAVFVVEPIVKGSYQTVGREGSPTYCKHREKDEDGGEGTGLEAHVYVHLEGSLEAQQAQFAGLAQADAIWVAVNADGIVADGVEDPHKSVQHDHERYEKEDEQ